jgi:hypothetical protein
MHDYTIEKYDFLHKVQILAKNNKLQLACLETKSSAKKEAICFFTKWRDDCKYVSPMSDLVAHCNRYSAITEGSQIWLSPQCKIPRDLVRTSYSIKRSPSQVTYNILPDKTDQFEEVRYEMLVKYTTVSEETHIIAITSSYYVSKQALLSKFNITQQALAYSCVGMVETNLSNIKSYVILDSMDIDVDTYDYVNGKPFTRMAWLVPKVEEYYALLTMEASPFDYVFETNLSFKGSQTLDAEILYMLYHNQDSEVVTSALSMSNWTEVPFTVIAFIFSYFYDAEKCGVTRGYMPSKCWDMCGLLKIKSCSWDSALQKLSTMTTTKKDAELLESWIFKELEVEDDTAMVSFEAFNKLPKPLQDCLAKRVLIKKQKYPKQVMYQDLKQSC